MAMTVQCTSCSTSFPVDPAKVPPGGVRARCSACGTIFRVERPSEPAEPSPRAVDEGPSVGDAPATPGNTSLDADAPGSAPGDASVGAAAVDDWVIEREPDIDPSQIEVKRLDTVEEGTRTHQDELAGGSPAAGEAPAPGAPEAGGAGTTFSAEPPAPAPGGPGEAASPTPSAPVQGFSFGRRDPKERASRLARVLVSDMVTYNAELHQKALANGTLKEDFEEEIRKSWEEYVEQVGQEVAESTSYFNDALNEILARGRSVF